MNEPGQFPEYFVFVLSTFYLCSAPLRSLLTRYNVPLHQNFCIMVLACLFGSIMRYHPQKLELMTILKYGSAGILKMYVPVFIFLTMYNIDFYVLKRRILQVLILLLANCLAKIIIVTITNWTVTHPEWSISVSILAALTCVPIEHIVVITMFNEVAQNKIVCTMLRSEAVLTLVPLITTFYVANGVQNGVVTHWYHFISIPARLIFGGLIFGFIFGKITTFAICFSNKNPMSSAIVCLTCLIFTYILLNSLISVSGALSVITLSIVVAIEKHNIPNVVESFISNSFHFLYFFFNTGILMLYSAYAVMTLSVKINIITIYYAVLIYFAINIARFIVYFTIGLLLSKFVRFIGIRQLIVLSWSGIGGCLNFMVLLHIGTGTKEKTEPILVELFIITLLSLLINCSALKLSLSLLGMIELSITPTSNLNNCIKFIEDRRITTIQMIKRNRHLSNADWAVVRNETNIKNWYKTQVNKNINEVPEDNILRSTSSATCPKCSKEVPFFVSEKEIIELMNEARTKIAKAKKISITNQYENGAINKRVYHVLLNLFESITGNASKEEFTYIKKYLNKFPKHRQKEIKIKQGIIEPPRHFLYRRICFYIMMHVYYDYILLTLILIQLAICIWDIIRNQQMIHFYNTILLFFIADCVIKVLGHSTSTIGLGFKTYLSDPWNKVDFSLLFVQLFEVFLYLALQNTVEYIGLGFIVITLIRLIRMIFLFLPVIKFLYLKKWHGNTTIYFGYELATALLNCYEEVIDVLPELIEVKAVRDNYQHSINNIKIALMKEMDLIQMELPSIAITAKTRQTISSTLKLMEGTLNQLNSTGFIDSRETDHILRIIQRQQKGLQRIKFVQPSPPKVIFNEVPWMAGNERVIDFLYNKVETVTWSVGEVICQEGQFSKGIYIVVTGLLKLKFIPSEAVLNRAKLGQIPVVDYLTTLKFDTNMEDTITSGNTFGELCFLTSRPYDCTIVAESPSQAYLLTFSIIAEAMKLDPSGIDGLEGRMWKCAVFHLSVAVLMNVPLYHSFTQEQIILKLQRCFVPDLSLYKIFTVTDGMEDIILIKGVAADNTDGSIFTAPMLIPKTVQKLLLPTSSFFSFEEIVKTKLVIIPNININNFEVLEQEGEFIEMKLMKSSKCLLHLVKDRPGGKRKGNSRKNDEKTPQSSYSSSTMGMNDESHEKLV